MKEIISFSQLIQLIVMSMIVSLAIGAVLSIVLDKELEKPTEFQTTCQQICHSNSLIYYKVTEYNLGVTCYCKDFEGGISTWQM